MFDDISQKYDLLNDVLSAGTHRWWKRDFVKLVASRNPRKVLDCATGTGDIAFLLEKKVPTVIGLDFSEGMINEAKLRAKKKRSNVGFVVGDIQKLPFADKEFDAVCISFGIRNVENLNLGLKELGRVAKNVYILEFGQPRKEWFSKTYFNLLKLYVPVFGMITKRKDAYEYLIESSQKFPSDDAFVELMKLNMNFSSYAATPVFGGIAYIYTATSEDA
jgi:demethylmenaquinone methyltransferase/2-methoxy-6-polyprenyl-1,4-benzoquinol methylase